MTLPVRRSGSPLPRWDPFEEFEELHRRTGPLFEVSLADPAGDSGTLRWSPLADLTESQDAYLIEVDLPGIKRDDITIDLTGDEIAISGGFGYRTSLPRDIDTENITAELADGVLTVRIPRVPAAKPRRIAITGG